LIEKDVWENCYEGGWRKLIVPEAFCHPAKFSRGLIKRIYEHAIEENWVSIGDTVLDPFGGVALGALDAITNRLNWVGVELEEKFVKLGEKNISYWKEWMRGDLGIARIIQGDSRNLKSMIEKVDLVISSPPYADSLSGSDKPQDHKRHQELATKAGHGRIGCGQLRYQNAYGRTKGNLSIMKEGDIDLVVSSPPFENCHNIVPVEGHSRQVTSERVKSKIRYGYNKNQLGNTSGDTFWSASKEIVQECYDLLKQDGHAIWVAKDYVSKGKLIPFSDRWVALCESVGFKVVCWHHAMVVKQTPQHTFDDSKIIKERKSFFRRIQEKKGSPRIGKM
jgi:DNA modification methylase